MNDLKLVYKADTEELALPNLDELKSKWDDKYGSVVDFYYENWGVTLLKFEIMFKDRINEALAI